MTDTTAAIEQALRGTPLSDAISEVRCSECGAKIAPGALASGLATREHENAAFALDAIWCRSHAPDAIPEPTRAREQVLFQADVGSVVDTAAQQHTPVALTPVMVAHSPVERVVADGGTEILVGGRNNRGDDAVVLHDETGRFADGD